MEVFRFWVSYLATVRPSVKHGALVVADRWAYVYIAQPFAARYYGPNALARAGVTKVFLPPGRQEVRINIGPDPLQKKLDERNRLLKEHKHAERTQSRR